MNKDFKDTGKILVAYGPNGVFALDTNSEIFLENVIFENSMVDLITTPGCMIAEEWHSHEYGLYIWEGLINQEGFYQHIRGIYYATKETSLLDGIEKKILIEGKHRCGHCSKVAKYLSMESGRNFLYRDYYCETCVPRGDSTYNEGKEEINLEDTYKALSGEILKGDSLKLYVDNMGEEEFIVPLDENGKEFPSCDMFFNEEGFTND